MAKNLFRRVYAKLTGQAPNWDADSFKNYQQHVYRTDSQGRNSERITPEATVELDETLRILGGVQVTVKDYFKDRTEEDLDKITVETQTSSSDGEFKYRTSLIHQGSDVYSRTPSDLAIGSIYHDRNGDDLHFYISLAHEVISFHPEQFEEKDLINGEILTTSAYYSLEDHIDIIVKENGFTACVIPLKTAEEINEEQNLEDDKKLRQKENVVISSAWKYNEDSKNLTLQDHNIID
jgi:hypothetical protein